MAPFLWLAMERAMPAECTLHVAVTERLVRSVRAQAALETLMQRDGTAERQVDGAGAGRPDHG